MSGSNPLAAVLASEGQGSNPLAMAGNVINMARGAQDLKTSQFNLQQSQLQPGYQAMRMLMATNPNPTNDDINAALGGAARLGGNVDGLVANFTDWTARGGTPADFMRATALGGMTPAEQGALAGPHMQARQTAQGTYYGTEGGAWSANAGQFNPAGFVAQGLSPGQWATPTQVFDPQTQTFKMQPFGQAYGYPMPPGLGGSGGGGGGGGGPAGGGVGVGGAPLLPPGAPADVAAARIDQIGMRESGNQNIPNRQGSGGSPLSSASGPYQFLDSTWQQAAREYGIPNPTQRAMDTDPAIQRAVAIKFLQNHGEQPWATSAPQGRGGGGGGGGPPAAGPFVGATSAQPVSSAGGMQYFPASPGGVGGYGGGGGGPGASAPDRSLAVPPPGFEKTAGASVDMFNTARANFTQQAQRISPLEQSLATLRSHPDLQTGMTAMDFQNINSLAQVLGVQLSPETIADGSALTEINKNLNRYYRGLPGANRSDMAELDAKLANPSPENQRDALDDLLARTIGAERMNDAGYMHFLESHGSGNASNYAHQYADQTGQYTSKLDPVGFAFDKMTIQQRRAYFDSLGPTEKTRYMNSIKEASRLYNLPIPQGG